MIINETLYQQIVRVMPIPCVDLVVVNNYGQVLLAKRRNEPAKNEWWFPGGRVYYLESRLDAAKRKLREECGLETNQMVELGTFDVILENLSNHGRSHAITTLFFAGVVRNERVVLDYQNSGAEWRLPQEWIKSDLPSFVQQGLEVYNKFSDCRRSKFL